MDDNFKNVRESCHKEPCMTVSLVKLEHENTLHRLNSFICEYKEAVDHVDRRQEKILEELTLIKDNINKQKGFYAGVVFAAGSLISVIVYIISQVVDVHK